MDNQNTIAMNASSKHYNKNLHGYKETINEEKLAVVVRNAEYCHRGSQQKVFNGLNMSVPQGCIYGLTGSSGCGKTTLISCILATRKLEQGEIFLFGCNINNPNRHDFVQIPGRDVGYMPQETSLYSKFTMLEILMYFGRLYGIKSDDIVEKSEEILELLQFNKRSTPIEQLSGGQQRRVSFAVSLIHSPKLLVLDEPTVGMDALLRVRIWNHLKKIVKEEQVTAIITSHYFDEMRKADKIGIMRNGNIIAENSPENLLLSCNVESLDEAVLHLCRDADLNVLQNHGCINQENFEYASKQNYEQVTGLQNFERGISRIKVLTEKNLSLIVRSIPLLLFVICIPSIQLLSIFIVGKEPYPQKIGVFNQELFGISTASDVQENPSSFLHSCPDFTNKDLASCNLQLLSCIFLHYISKKKVSLIHFQSEEEAISAVEKGHSMGYINFPSNFSTSLVDRALNEHNGTVDNDLFDYARILVRFDQSNAISYRLVYSELINAQETFLVSMLSACTTNPKFAEYPLQYGPPIFGVADEFNYGYDISPGATIPFLFYYPIVSSGIRFIQERNCGMLDRSLISGVQFPEILAAYLVSEFILVILQSSAIYVLLVWNTISQIDHLCSHIIAFILFMLSGYTGVSLGFLLGSLCKEEIQVAIISIACIFPNTLLGGIIWPIEAMPILFQHFVQVLPCTITSNSMFAIWSRGLSISDIQVWSGIVVFVAYILVLNFITLMYHRYVRK